MARQTATDDDDYEFDDDDSLNPCPYCHQEIPTDAPRCPYCRNYISQEEGVSNHKPWWFVLGFAMLGVSLLGYVFIHFVVDLLDFQFNQEGQFESILWIAGLLLVAGTSLFLLNAFMRRFCGVSLLCHVGIHRWQKEFSGQGRDRSHVLTCRSCGAHKDDY